MKHTINQFRTLLCLFKLDKTDHPIKVLAELFLSALRDWPSNERLSITDSIIAFKAYFGEPLTVKNTAHYTGRDMKDWTWKGESGMALSAMITYASEHYGVTDFDAIVELLLSHYEAKLPYN